jgi:hypothetical protein
MRGINKKMTMLAPGGILMAFSAPQVITISAPFVNIDIIPKIDPLVSPDYSTGIGP